MSTAALDAQVSILKKYLSSAAWVAWVDCDSFFMDDSKKITDLLPDPVAQPDIDFVVSEDGLTVNTGKQRYNVCVGVLCCL